MVLKKRETNIELLRVISMFIIVMNHYVVNDATLAVRDNMPLCLNKVVLQFLQFGGGLGVNIFVLISAYFVSVQTEIKKTRIIKLILDSSIYSCGIYCIAMILGYHVGVITLIKSIFPVIYPVWWFVTAYVLLSITSKYINMFIKSTNKEIIDSVIKLLVIVLSLLPTIMNSEMEDSNYLWFVLLYLIAARIRIYPINNIILKKYSLNVGVLCYFFTLLTSLILDLIGEYIPILSAHAVFFSKKTSFFMLISSVLIFYGVLNTKVKYSMLINKIASTTFGIYLIHMHPFVQKILWTDIMRNPIYINTNVMILHLLMASIIVFVICSAVSFLYNCSLGKVTLWLAKKIERLKFTGYFFKGGNSWKRIKKIE